MNFESEGAFKNWLKVNGYDSADADSISSSWSSVSIVEGQIVGIVSTQETVTEVAEEIPSNS